MTKKLDKFHKLETEDRAIGKRLGEIGLIAESELTTEVRAEQLTLRQRSPVVKGLLQEAFDEQRAEQEKGVNGDGIDAEARAFQALRGEVGLKPIHRRRPPRRETVDGAALELNQALKIGAHRFPLQLLAPVEERATTNIDTGAVAVRWLDRLFSSAAAARVGVTFESVEPGAKSYPIIKTGASGAQRGRKEAAAVAAWTAGVTELKPTRNAVHAVFSREDDLRNPGLQDALTRDLRMALMDAVDLAIFEGDADADEDTADITGLKTAADVVEEEIAQAAKVKGADVLLAFAGLIDGKHATAGSDLRTVLSVGAQRLWMSTLANTGNAADTTISEFLARAGIVVSARGGISAVTTANAFGGYVGRARGIEGAGVAAVWSDGMLIIDPYSSAKTGEIQLSMNTFWNFGLPRPSNFARLKFV